MGTTIYSEKKIYIYIVNGDIKVAAVGWLIHLIWYIHYDANKEPKMQY